MKEYVYHGSHTPKLSVITPHMSTHKNKWVYATPSKAIATIFLSPMHSDYYYYLEGDGLTSDVILVERKPGMFKKIFNFSGYIYKLDAKNFESGKTNWSAEVVSNKDEKIIESYYIENIYTELLKLNDQKLIKLYIYPNRPSNIPLDNSDLITKVAKWHKNGINIDKFYELYPELKEKILKIINEENIMIIRQATEKDAESIINININGWKGTYYGIFPNEILSNLEQKKEESIEKCKTKIKEYLVCEIDDKVVGFLRYGKNKKNYNDKYAEVYALYIDTQYKKRGIGRKLIEYAFANLKDTYDHVLISTLQKNPATKFYEKCGGKQIGTSYFKLEDNEYLENLYLFNLK